MAFTYGETEPGDFCKEFDFPSLKDGASLYCDQKAEANLIAASYDAWSFANRTLLRASVLPTSITESRKRRGWRVWIATNRDGVEGLGNIDAFAEWTKERLRKTLEEPADGWKSTRELYSDFTSWADHNGFFKAYLPPINTFSQRLKSASIGIRLKRLATGNVAMGVVITDEPMMRPLPEYQGDI